MTDIERMKSILSEIEYGYIGYDNLHGDDGHGLELIKTALEKQMPEEPNIKTEDLVTLGGVYKYKYYQCPRCGMDIGSYEDVCCCDGCGQAINWEGVE